MKIKFVTTNKEKFAVAENFLRKFGLSENIKLEQQFLESPEIQSEFVEEVALFSARWLAKELNEACVVTDAGFYIEALNGFPGPFVKNMNKWFNQEDLLRLMEQKKNRKVYFADALAYAEPGGEEKVFLAKTYGKLALTSCDIIKPTVDALFIPDGFPKTLAEMSQEERFEVWDQTRWQRLVEYLSQKKF